MAQRISLLKNLNRKLPSVQKLTEGFIVEKPRRGPRKILSVQRPKSTGRHFPNSALAKKWKRPPNIYDLFPSWRKNLKDKPAREVCEYQELKVTEPIGLTGLQVVSIIQPTKRIFSAEASNPHLDAGGNGPRQPKLVPNVAAKKRRPIRAHVIRDNRTFKRENSE
jgi:hypothetical protein